MRRAALAALLVLLSALLPTVAVATDAGDAPTAIEGDSAAVDEVVAQTSNNSTANETEVYARLDSTIDIVRWNYDQNNETMFVTLRNRGDRDKTVTITEIVRAEDVQGERGSVRFGIATPEVDGGETLTVSVDVAARGKSAGVTVTTQESAESGRGEALLQKLDGGDARVIKGEPSGSQVRSAAFFGSIFMLVFTSLGAWQYVAAKNEDVREADLSPKLSLLGRFRDR